MHEYNLRRSSSVFQAIKSFSLRKTQKSHFWLGFLQWVFCGFFGLGFLGWVYCANPGQHPCISCLVQYTCSGEKALYFMYTSITANHITNQHSLQSSVPCNCFHQLTQTYIALNPPSPQPSPSILSSHLFCTLHYSEALNFTSESTSNKDPSHFIRTFRFTISNLFLIAGRHS